MGNKHTKSKPEAKQEVRQQEAKVRMREGRKERGKRPMSEPTDTDDIQIDFSQFTFGNQNRSDSKVIGGRGVVGVSSDIPVVDYEETASDTRATGAQLTILEKALEQLLAIWPEYRPVTEITTRELPSPVVTTLTTIANRLHEQYNVIKNLSEQVHEFKQINSELQEERDYKSQLARKREIERNGLREDVTLLRAELHKRGLDVKLPSRPAPSRDDRLSTPRDDDDDVTRSDVTTPRSGIYSPTPIILAEGEKSRQVLQRHASLRTTPGLDSTGAHLRLDSSGRQRLDSTSAGDDQWQWSEANAPDELKQRVKMLELALERERKEKLLLKERIEMGSPTSKRASSRGTSEIYAEELSAAFSRLQRQAFDRVRRQVSHQLPRVNIDKQRAFICAVMQVSYNVAKERYSALMENVESVICNPTKPNNTRIRTSGLKPARSGSILENVRQFELAQRAGYKKERLPAHLVTCLTSFIEHSADVTDVLPLTEGAVDKLQRDYADCTLASLLNQPVFSAFLHDCCALAWRMNTVSPPYHLATDASRFEPAYHETDSAIDEIVRDIDFFLWPTLFARKHGDVLNKGIVQLK